MKHHFLLGLIFIILQNIATSQTTDQNKILIGVFDGRTPCNYFGKQLSKKASEECIKIKWRLAMYKDDESANSGTYEMIGLVYKKDSPRKGNWQISKGIPSDPNAIVYQLEETGMEPILLLKGDDNVLFFLDSEKNLLVGNSDFSYTLNRVNKTSL